MKSQIETLQKQMYITGSNGSLYLTERTDPIFEEITKEQIFQYCQRSPLVQPVHNAIIREITNTPWVIKPLFNYKCIVCEETYDQKPESGKCTCGGNLVEPDPAQKKVFTQFIDNPSPEVDLYEIIRSYLKWVLSIDDGYISVSYIGRNKSGKMILSKKPLGLFVENGLHLKKIRPEDNEYGYFCPICNLEEEEDSVSKEPEICTKHKIPLWETAYALVSGINITRRYSKKEIIEGHFNRILPDEYGTPILNSCLDQVKVTKQIDLFNLGNFEEGKLGKIFAFSGTTQAEVESIGNRVKEIQDAARKLKKKITNMWLASPGDLKVTDVLDDPSKLEAIEWHKYYRDLVFSCHGVMPVVAGSVESGKAGNNPGLQIEVQHDTTKAWMKVVTEPMNTVLMEQLGITDWYFDFEEVEIADDREDAEIEKIRAETVAIYIRSGYEVEFNDDGSLKPPKKMEKEPGDPKEDANSQLAEYEENTNSKLAKSQRQWHAYIPDNFMDEPEKIMSAVAKRYEQNINNVFEIYNIHADRSRLIQEIESEVADTAKALDVTLRHYLFPLYLESYRKITSEYTKLFQKAALDSPDPYALAHMQEFMGKYETPYFKSWSDREKAKIFQIIDEEAARGYNWQTVSRRLKKYFQTRDSYYWKMVARTEGTRIFIEAGTEAAKELGAIEKRWIFQDDGLNCEHCAEAFLEGWIPIDDIPQAGQNIPLHPHCRCYYEFRTQSMKDEGWDAREDIRIRGLDLDEVKVPWDALNAEQRPEFTKEMHDALWEYSSTSYYINTILRYPKEYLKKITYKLQIERSLKAIETLREIFGLPNSKLTEDVILWRGVDELELEKLRLDPEDPELKDILNDPGFLSASKDIQIALAFGHRDDIIGPRITLMKIHAPKGTKVIYIGDSYGYAQKEVIFQDGSLFQINNITTRPLTQEEMEFMIDSEGWDPEVLANTDVKIYDVSYMGDANS